MTVEQGVSVMALADITKSAVELALAEYDELGRDEFLQRYGFSDAKQYWLIYNGQAYPSKAIAGVAHKYVADNQILPSPSFSGGEETVVKKLRQLGFEVKAVGRNPDWIRDELILALDLYLRNPISPPRQSSVEVSELSDLLNRMHRQKGTVAVGHDLRNNNGVYLKMMNYRALDPTFTSQGKVGMSSGGKLERAIWNEYAGRHQALAADALAIRQSLQSPVEESEGEGENSRLPSGRVWITQFWGFNPELDGYLGFTREGDRTAFLRKLRPGDLVMVYGTMSDKADPGDRGRVMGFLEVERRTIRDVERMAPDGLSWKIRNGMTDRWTYAVPVVRAWRTVDKPPAKLIAPTTLGPGANFRLIAGRGVFLRPEEALAALSIPVRPVQPFGAELLPEEEKTKVYTPSKGFPMSFGRRAFETHDGEHFLYMLRLNGDASAVVDEPEHQLRGKIVVKVGLAKDPGNRCLQHNACLPPAGKLRWKVALQSKPLPDGDTALATETALKETFAASYRSLGGEFFLCDERTVESTFIKATV